MTGEEVRQVLVARGHDEAKVAEYVEAAEHQDGESCWDELFDVDTIHDAIEADYELYVEYSD